MTGELFRRYFALPNDSILAIEEPVLETAWLGGRFPGTAVGGDPGCTAADRRDVWKDAARLLLGVVGALLHHYRDGGVCVAGRLRLVRAIGLDDSVAGFCGACLLGFF